MKSQRAMAEELLARAHWDGTYPKAVILGLGVVALAHTPEEWERLCRESDRQMAFLGWGIIAITVGVVGAIVAMAILGA